MGRLVSRLSLAALIALISGCGIRWVETLPLPNGGSAIYVGAQSRILGMGVIDRWQYDPQTKKVALVRSDCSVPMKLEDAVKGIPLPVIP